MAEFGRDYEILVLDDASTDCTREVLKGYRSRLPLRILRNDESVGESAGFESLLREAVISTKYPKRDSAVTLRSDFRKNKTFFFSEYCTFFNGSASRESVL